MHTSQVIRAWRWLMEHLVIAALVSYLSVLTLSGLGLASPETILKATTVGLRNIGAPILNQGVAFGIDRGVMIFFCNLTVALLIVAIVYWARLLNPYNQNSSFLRLRTQLQKDRSAEHLRRIPFFARIEPSQLRLTSFLLLGAPFCSESWRGYCSARSTY